MQPSQINCLGFDNYIVWLHLQLAEGKSWGVCLVQLCVKYRLVSATLSPYHQCQKTKEAVSLEVKGPTHSYLLIMSLKYHHRRTTNTPGNCFAL